MAGNQRFKFDAGTVAEVAGTVAEGGTVAEEGICGKCYKIE